MFRPIVIFEEVEIFEGHQLVSSVIPQILFYYYYTHGIRVLELSPGR